MTPDQLEKWEHYLMKEIVERRGRGGYSPEATTILKMLEFQYQQILDMKPKVLRPKSKRERAREE